MKIKELELKVEQHLKKDEGKMAFNMSTGATSEQAAVLEEIEQTSNTTATEEVTNQAEEPAKENNTQPVEEVTEVAESKSDAVKIKEYKAEIKKLSDGLIAAGMEDQIPNSSKINDLKALLKPLEDA